MHICALFGGMHKKGNTATLLEKVLEGARSKGHSTERFNVADLNIHPCKGCLGCKQPKSNGCVQHDDMEQICTAIANADVLIFSTPMYWWNLSGPLKNVVDRFFALPFYAQKEASAFSGKKCLLVMTSGQPKERDGSEGLSLIMEKMCSFTGMQWIGLVSTGTNDTPISEQNEVLQSAFEVGANL